MPTDTSATYGITPCPKRKSFMTIAFQLWQMIFDVMAQRKTRAALSALDDYLLKDIGLSRGEIERVAMEATGFQHEYRRPPTPGQLRAAAGSRLLHPASRA